MPPRSLREGVDSDLAMASTMAQLVTSISPEEAERLRQAMWDLALGEVVLIPVGKKAPQDARVAEITTIDDEGEMTARVYIRPPDPVMIRQLVEQNIGRPGTRVAREQEQMIQVMHAIPGWDEADEETMDVDTEGLYLRELDEDEIR